MWRKGRWRLSHGSRKSVQQDQLCRGAWAPYLHQVEVFRDRKVLLDSRNRFGFEGRREWHYASGSSHWVGQGEMPELQARRR